MSASTSSSWVVTVPCSALPSIGVTRPNDSEVSNRPRLRTLAAASATPLLSMSAARFTKLRASGTGSPPPSNSCAWNGVIEIMNRELHDVADRIILGCGDSVAKQQPVRRNTLEWLEQRSGVEKLHRLIGAELAEVEHQLDTVSRRQQDELPGFLHAIAIADGDRLRKQAAVVGHKVDRDVGIAERQDVEARVRAVELSGTRVSSGHIVVRPGHAVDEDRIAEELRHYRGRVVSKLVVERSSAPHRRRSRRCRAADHPCRQDNRAGHRP